METTGEMGEMKEKALRVFLSHAFLLGSKLVMDMHLICQATHLKLWSLPDSINPHLSPSSGLAA